MANIWLDAFEDIPELMKVEYWDLIAGMYKKEDLGQCTKLTEAAKFIKRSDRSSESFVKKAVEQGWIIEKRMPDKDKRAKFLTLSPSVRDRFLTVCKSFVDLIRESGLHG